MRVTVIGSRGMAGHVISRYLAHQGHEVIEVDRMELDVENSTSVLRFFDKLNCDYVINAIGMLVKASVDRPDRASIVNSWWPQYLAFRLAHTRTRLIHLSTDCVFDGTQGPYKELDAHTELNAYGRSKSLGEVNNAKDITMRMSIIGPELKNGTGLMHWISNNTESVIPGWTNAWWNGMTTLQLAKCIDSWINDPGVTGVCHVVNNDVRTTKYDLLCEINTAMRLNKKIVPIQGPKSVNKILINTRNDYDWQIADYATQLRQLCDWYHTRTH